MHKEGIAIIGIGCRFPGGINDAESLWKLLVEGREAVSEVPPDRWNLDRFYDSEPGVAGKSIARRGGFIDGIDQFDPQFFGISPREAPYVDPQHRLLLETAWEAIEDASIVLDLERGTDLAVFVGISHNDYQVIQGTAWDSFGISPHSPTGTAHSIAANRISYCFNLRGPSVALDTACSSALTAVHMACEHIWSGHGETALAGGVTVMITQGGFVGFSQASMLSPEGRCKAFDASANGFVRGEGAGVVVLKALSKAIEDGDPIHAVIVGSAINQDGHTNGISLPSAEAQARLVRDACKDAEIAPAAVGFVEAHGTGTAVGDPIEAHALAEALCADRPTDAPLAIGSIKTNLGHLETAAGLAGLVKAALVLKHGQIPASLHFETPNPHIDFAALKIRVPIALEEFPKTNGLRVAGVNSFGFGGSNAHIILTEPPPRPRSTAPASASERSWPLTLSARSEGALRASTARLSEWLAAKEKSNGSSQTLPDLAYTLGARRNHHQHRLTLVARSSEEVIQELDAYAQGRSAPKVRNAFSPRPESPPRIAFVMSGQGPQWWGMGREFMEHEPVFRRTIEASDKAMRPWGYSLLEELGRQEAGSQLHRTEIAQPAIFAMQVALAELWKSWGVMPTAVIGHSVGEVAAACIAGVFSLEQAARVIVLRARFMDHCAQGEGTMLAVGLNEDEAHAIITRYDRNLTIAAFNGPRSLTLSGARLSLEAIARELEGQGTFARLVRVDHPFHHPLMQPASEELEAALVDLVPLEETIPLFSTVTGSRHFGRECDAAHWGRGIRQPVQFASAIGSLDDFGVDLWLEIGAHPALLVSIQECLAARGKKQPALASARREREHESVLETAMELHRACVPLNFASMLPSRRLLSLPAYAWDKSRWWNESGDWREGRLGAGGRGLLDARLPRATPTWIARLDSRHMAFLQDHRVESFTIFPAAAFAEMALEAGAQLFEGRPFVIEDFEIRKPLILPDPSSALLLELAYEPGARTFSIQSRLEQGVAWSTHVIGSLRSERTDSAFAACAWSDSVDARLKAVEIDEFYNHMSAFGLRYGEEFRPIRELSAGAGQSVGKVSLSERVAHRAAEYQLHPVLLDGALHVFSAGAATVEGRKARMKLPVRFDRILFLRSPGASSLVRTTVQDYGDEFVQGKLWLYDEAGKPCVLVDGFRAISLASARRSSASGSREILYHVGWERTTTSSRPSLQAPVALSRLRDIAREALEQVIASRDRDKLQASMAACDELAAAQLARGLREMCSHGEHNQILTSSSLRVAESMQPVFESLLAGLARRRMLERVPTGYRTTPAFETAADSADQKLRWFIANHSGHLAEGLLCAANCSELGALLRGEKEAVQILFAGAGADLLDQFYGDGLFTSQWLAAIAAAVQEVAGHLPEGRGLRILEVGAGTGGLTSLVLPLLERRLHSYTFSDVSAAFFVGAMQKLAAFPEVEFKVFDLEKPGTEQGFEAGSFDLILGANVLHAASEVRVALQHIHELLSPGGSLLFIDTATPQLWTESLFGLTSGWWRFKDRDLRPSHPLLDRSQWEKVLRETGFSETASLPGLIGPEGGEGQIGVLARKACHRVAEENPAEAQTVEETPKEMSWLIFADNSGLGARLASRLRELGARCRLAHRGSLYAVEGMDAFTLRAEMPEDWKKLFEAAADDAPDRLVYLWPLDECLEDDPVLMGTSGLLHLAQALEVTRPTAKLRIDLVTRGAQPAGSAMNATAVEQSPAIGLMRVILNEHSHLVCRAIDLSPSASASDESLIWTELMRNDSEREIAFRGEARYVRRLARGRPHREQWLDPKTPLRLESRERGHLDTLQFAPFVLPHCGAREVQIEVKAAGMNFRDVLKALALYPGEAPDAGIFGDEVAGVVAAVGADVTHVKPGDRVFGIAAFGLATHALARAGDVRRIPPGLSFDEAATLPVVFMTAWHALKNVARVRAGERILIHAGAGGVGMAAIQIAHHLGLDVIASAGSPIKRALLETLGVKRVIDSRRADFADAVMELTAGRGVDVVLNSLAGEAIPMGLSCLAEFGRFVEIGKRDIYQNTRIPLWPLRRNASFHVVAMDAVFSGDEELACQLLREIAELVELGALSPLPFRSFPACKIDAAFRLMAQGKHVGKVVVAFPEPFVLRRGEPLAPAFVVRQDASYLITGAFGGFGRVLALWLVERGARHLVLAGRRGAATPEAEAFVQNLRVHGVDVRIARVDVSSATDVRELVSTIREGDHPLRGVFHLAMVIDDAPLASLTCDRMRTVMAPKAHGAWRLHEATRDLELDCFVMFSSVSSIFGNPAQGNYAAANAFLDALAHHRRALGMPALTVNWGVLGGQGYVARNERVAEFLARQGTAAISPSEVLALLESFLASGIAQVIAIRVDWTKWRQFFRGSQDNPVLQDIFASGIDSQETPGATTDWRPKIDSAPPEEREAIIAQAVRDVVGSVLRVKPETLRDDQPLTDLGLDSLMGAEIENSLESAIGVGLPPTSLMRTRTVGQIAALIAGHMGGAPAPAVAAEPAPAKPSPAEEVDIEALSNEEIDRLLDGEMSAGSGPELSQERPDAIAGT
jgi:acyl transferase domain-containing protein/NADPH:quinone reductase-like Zn-dependent oxidoreductase/NAD(P)-dependent dehydrogenase (short-subunit alcohol dehydrogenase family)/SAM-dependent methyltransferase/acyl carrier protein